MLKMYSLKLYLNNDNFIYVIFTQCTLLSETLLVLQDWNSEFAHIQKCFYCSCWNLQHYFWFKPTALRLFSFFFWDKNKRLAPNRRTLQPIYTVVVFFFDHFWIKSALKSTENVPVAHQHRRVNTHSHTHTLRVRVERAALGATTPRCLVPLHIDYYVYVQYL